MAPNKPMENPTRQRLNVLAPHLDGLILRPTPERALTRLHVDDLLANGKNGSKVHTTDLTNILVNIWFGGIDQSAEYRFLHERNQENNFLKLTNQEQSALPPSQHRNLKNQEQNKETGNRSNAEILELFLQKYNIDPNEIDLMPSMGPERNLPKALIVINTDGQAFQLKGSSSLSSYLFLSGRLLHAACHTVKHGKDTLGIISSPCRKRIFFYLESSKNQTPAIPHKVKNFEKALPLILTGKHPVVQFTAPSIITTGISSALKSGLTEGPEKSDLADSIFDTIVCPTKTTNPPQPPSRRICSCICRSLSSLFGRPRPGEPLAHKQLDHDTKSNDATLAL